MKNNNLKYKAIEEQLLLFPCDNEVDTEVPPSKQAPLLYIESTDIHYHESNISIYRDLGFSAINQISEFNFL